jgi:mono/diheme cytochrome c family protein
MAVRLPTTSPGLTANKALVMVALPFLTVLGALLAEAGDKTQPKSAGKPFARTGEVRRILEARCVTCHGGKATRGGLDLTTRARLLHGGRSGKAVIPGKAQESRLYRLITHADKPGMPYQRERLARAQIDLLAAWIDAGAPYDRPLSKEPEKKGAGWWSLKPIVKPAPPAVGLARPEDWARTPIDRFILAKLREKGLAPSPAADRRTLLRRVTFDLIGLPPTPAELAAFLADNSPDAYERVVDRLLASPHYGERWARHWMDVVHYAETHGHDQDRPRENAWPYRDYLIRSFNQDKPYARFVREQIAGDVLFPDDPDAVRALGFLATGPWDESSLRDIREDTIDRAIARYLDRDDMVTTAMSTFVSTTVHCARCHDHKFDPVSQEEYYALQAVFAGVDKAQRPYDPDPQLAARRRRLRQEKARLALGKVSESALLTPAAQAEVAAWEKKAAAVVWTPLDPVTYTSAGGAKLTRLADRSVLSGGKRPDVDTYTIVAHTDVQGITGIRLEVLTDDSLPHKGPGRQDNGNLHLNEFKVKAAPKNKKKPLAPRGRGVGGEGESRPVVLQNPSADFNQEGWTIAMAVDGKPQTAWGIYPKVGQPHRAVFEVKEPIRFAGGTTLTFVLEQTHGGGHLIGRVRLSVTNSPKPLSGMAAALPNGLAQVLAVPAAKRTGHQKAELARYVLGQRLGRELAALPPQQLVYAAANDFKPEGSFKPAPKPRPVHMLKRGDINRPGAAARPGALACVSGLAPRFRLANPDDEGSRRAALARWLTDRNNVLAWRSLVNRIWHYHFGRGLVETPNDFGRMGSLPSHPELLDWLAATFRDGGGSIKRLHRLIVTSAVYRQSVRHNPRFAEIDADNRYLWRMNRTRLDAEEVRDAVLLAAGKLDRAMGGPSVRQFIQKPGIHVTPVVDYLHFDVDRAENRRRSVYRFIFRTLPDPFMEALDCPDSSQLTPARNGSVSALQALAMLNNKIMVRMSEHLAERAARAGPDLATRVEAVYQLVLGRKPTQRESEAVTKYAAKHGLANACRILLNSNEFMFVN